ncbi:hypothetical protein [Pseudodesulfovibrio sediminis]|uniref:Uncharacterized protein n=1 Tax=Pseudodesulfovibrio sediminis TaxID=2810563 RepID=A0ABN6EQ02_9BACT|nr:hypothetical protein [Pseudodesulfovibrio sediminis]BCS87325.1 hypothetical protein PSDVSF_05670 [Pseudodesulfovibrio sediminis]
MQITEDKNEVRYTASAGQTEFVFDFPVYLDTHLVVYDGEVVDGVTNWTEQTLTDDYTMVHTDEEAKTGKVVFTSGRTVGHKILIIRNVPLTQLSRYIDDDKLPAAVFETDINLGVMRDQQHAKLFAKCFRLPLTSELEDLSIPEPEAGKVLYWISTTEMGNKSLADLGAIALPLSVTDGGTGGDTVEDAVEGLGLTKAIKADESIVLEKGYPAQANAMVTSAPSPATGALQTIDTSGGAVDLGVPVAAGVIRFVASGDNALNPSASYGSIDGEYDTVIGLAQGEIVSDGTNHFLTIVNGVSA